MAYTSVIPVRRLDRAVKYVMNKEKTTAVSLQDAVDYAANRDKTEQSCFESSYACTLETAFADMRQTKEQLAQTGRCAGVSPCTEFCSRRGYTRTGAPNRKGTGRPCAGRAV